MPARMLRDGFVTSERVGALSDDAFRFYFSLFALVDDYGCIEWSPLALRGKLFPYADPLPSTVEMREKLEKCLKGPRPLIILYEVSGKSFIQIQEFGQRVQSKPRCPLPEIHGGKPLKAESESESESESKSESKSKSKRASAPAPPPADDFVGPDLAASTANQICEQHAAAGFLVGNPDQARRLLERILAEAGPNMARQAAAIVAAHGLFVPVWQDLRRADARAKVPQVSWWLTDKAYAHPPAKTATASTILASRPFRREDLPR